MKAFRKLFEAYANGALDDAGVAELNRLLTEAWFGSEYELTRDEQALADELVFDLHAANKLAAHQALIFEKRLSSDRSLFNRYRIHIDLTTAPEAAGKQRIHAEESDEQEEEQLKKILEEVIEKVQSEKQQVTYKEKNEHFMQAVRNFISGFLPDGLTGTSRGEARVYSGAGGSRIGLALRQNRLRLAVVASLLLFVTAAVWFTVYRIRTDQMAENMQNDTVVFKKSGDGGTGDIQQKTDLKEEMIRKSLPQDQFAEKKEKGTERTVQQGENPMKKEKSSREDRNQKVKELLAENLDVPERFDYILVRGVESSRVTDQFILAADKYNEKDYDSCILLLNGILATRSVKDRDTLGEVYFYLGTCFLVKGFNQTDNKLLDLSLQSYKSAGTQNQYFKPSMYYSALAHAKMGHTAESISILDNLLRMGYTRHGKVKDLRDALTK